MSELDELRASLETRTTDELVSILRNQDQDEWRPEVFELVASILAARGLSPAAVATMGPEGVEVVEPRRLLTIARYITAAQAHAARMALESAGLQAWVIDEALGTVYGLGKGTRLQVRVEDEPAARAVLDDEPGGTEMPPEVEEPPCPRCASRDLAVTSEEIEDPELRRARGGRRRDWYYACRACGHRWRDDAE